MRKGKEITGVAAKKTCFCGFGALKVDDKGYPNPFLEKNNLMAIFHVKGFGLAMLIFHTKLLIFLEHTFLKCENVIISLSIDQIMVIIRNEVWNSLQACTNSIRIV